MAVQCTAMVLGMASDMIAGDSFERAAEKAAEAGKDSIAGRIGGAAGDAAFTVVEAGREIINEDLPAAKKRASEAIDRARNWWKNL
jgi:hypothetical protein